MMRAALSEIARALDPAVWRMIAVCAALLVLLGWCSWDARREGREISAAAQARATQAEGRAAAARDASAVRDGNEAANQSTRDQIKDDHDALRREADPAVRDADAHRRLCALDPGACAG